MRFGKKPDIKEEVKFLKKMFNENKIDEILINISIQDDFLIALEKVAPGLKGRTVSTSDLMYIKKKLETNNA